MGSRHLLDDPAFFPFPPPPYSSSFPFLGAPHDSTPFSFDLDPFHPPTPLEPFPFPFLLHDLTDRVATLELALAARPQPSRRKYTYATEAAGRKVKWTAEEKPRGERALKWEAELKTPHHDGFDRKCKWESKSKPASSARKIKWGAELKGKGCLEPWSRSYTWEEDFDASDDDDKADSKEVDKNKTNKAKEDKKKKKEDKLLVNKEKKCPVAVKIQEIPEDNTAGCVAIRKAFAMGNGKGKRKELSPQDAALLIQLTYRAHLARRSQVLRCLRDLAVAKAKLKEIRSLFYSISYRHRTAHDLEERQRFSEKIIVLLLTVDALEVIAINKQFPGPIVNITTNYNVVVNVLNSLDEPLLITWDGIQHRKNCWEDGVLGTNCPIPPGWNWTYNFQVKDQIGSFFYFPPLGMQRAAGGFGGITVNNRAVISVPFDTPDGDFTLFMGDWYKKNHTDLRKMLDDGKELGMPDGVLMNGKGPYRYNDSLVPDGIEYETINVEPGKTYRFRVHNVGVSTSLNFRIQSHSLAIVETEGSYTMKQNFTNLDIHVGQSYSFLITMDQNASSDYYIVASARFVNESIWTRVTGVAILHYSNSKGKASGPLPDPPNDVYDKTFSMNQARSIRMNVSTGAARPNPQGSFHYGSINVSQVYKLRNEPPVTIDGKKRTTLNGISYSPPATPLRLADLYDEKGVYTLDFPTMPSDAPPVIGSSIINSTYKNFMEIVFQNNDTKVQTYHIDGYAFWVVGMDYGEWTENSRGTYNKWDGVSRCTTQVFPGAWTAVLLSLDSPGFWNVRTENLDTWYLGQETYIRVLDPAGGYNVTEMVAPDNILYCGRLKDKQKAQKPHGSSSSSSPAAKLNGYLLTAMVSLVALACVH